MGLKPAEAAALWCLGEGGRMPFAELQRQVGAGRRRLMQAVAGLVRKRLVRACAAVPEDGTPPGFLLTRRGRCVYDLLRTLESHVAAA